MPPYYLPPGQYYEFFHLQKDRKKALDQFLRAIIILHLPLARGFFDKASVDEFIPQHPPSILKENLCEALDRDCRGLYYQQPSRKAAKRLREKLWRDPLPHELATIDFNSQKNYRNVR